MGSLSIRRFAAATRSRVRFKSVYCRGSGRVRFLRGRFAALLPWMSCFPVATCAPITQSIHILTHASRLCMKQQLITALSCRTDSAEVAGAFSQYDHRVTALIDFQLDHDH